MEINVQKILNADILEILKLAFVLDENAVKKSFRNIGIDISSDNLEYFADLHRNHGDILGLYSNEKGERVFFDLETVLANTHSNFEEKFVVKKLNLIWE